MKNISYLSVAISLLILFACTKELPYPDVEAKDLLVMNGLISPETGATIHLSQSCHITDVNCEQKNVENAQVFLKDENGNQLVELTHTAQGQYTAVGFTVEHDKAYKIEAQSTGLETILSEGKTPKPFACRLTEIDENIIQTYLCRTFEIEIEDNPDEVNYYLIDGWVDILNGSHDEGYTYEFNGYQVAHTSFITNDINADNATMVSNVDYLVYPLEYIFLKDENFNGKTYTLTVGLHEGDIKFDPNLELIAHINVKSVSKEVYDYFQSVTSYKLTSANILAEPSQIFSNIEKGTGIFGGFTEHQFVVDLPTTEYYFLEDFRIENDGCTSPCVVQFSVDVGDKVNITWSFGDGNTSTEKSPSHEYQSPGIYLVEVFISIGNQKIGMSTEIEIF